MSFIEAPSDDGSPGRFAAVNRPPVNDRVSGNLVPRLRACDARPPLTDAPPLSTRLHQDVYGELDMLRGASPSTTVPCAATVTGRNQPAKSDFANAEIPFANRSRRQNSFPPICKHPGARERTGEGKNTTFTFLLENMHANVEFHVRT